MTLATPASRDASLLAAATSPAAYALPAAGAFYSRLRDQRHSPA